MPLNRGIDLRLEVLEMVQRAQIGDFCASLSVIDGLCALYLGRDNGKPLVRYDAVKPRASERDFVVVSDPAVVPAQYAVLAEAGFFSKAELKGFGKKGAMLSTIASTKVPGVDGAFARAGYGLAIGEGIARAHSVDKRANRVFVILTDDDLASGLTWEAAMSVAQSRLDSVTVLCLTAGLQRVKPVQEKWEAFGWKTFPVPDGHDRVALALALARAKEQRYLPACVVAPVTLGKGVPFLEGKSVYRGSLLSVQEFEVAQRSLVI